jgi:hypothetical protein
MAGTVDLKAGTIEVSRKKGGIGGVQHLTPTDARAWRALRCRADSSPFILVSEREGMQMPRDAFAKSWQPWALPLASTVGYAILMPCVTAPVMRWRKVVASTSISCRP